MKKLKCAIIHAIQGFRIKSQVSKALQLASRVLFLNAGRFGLKPCLHHCMAFDKLFNFSKLQFPSL